MPLLDTERNRIIRDYTIDDLIERANYMRGINEISLCSAGSGHSGGTLGIMDIIAALYLKVARHNLKDPVITAEEHQVGGLGNLVAAKHIASWARKLLHR